jgi:hypothetical protein
MPCVPLLASSNPFFSLRCFYLCLSRRWPLIAFSLCLSRRWPLIASSLCISRRWPLIAFSLQKWLLLLLLVILKLLHVIKIFLFSLKVLQIFWWWLLLLQILLLIIYFCSSIFCERLHYGYFLSNSHRGNLVGRTLVGILAIICSKTGKDICML